jgi:hypothetical protein
MLSESSARQNTTSAWENDDTSLPLEDPAKSVCRTTTSVSESDPSKNFLHQREMFHIDKENNKHFRSVILISPYAYNFGLGKRADAEDSANYDEDSELYSDTNNFDKSGLNMENWENGGYMDNKNDIDVIDYDLMGYPRGELS